MKTIKPYTLVFRNYGEITVPAGTSVTHLTACGYDEKYHFVQDLSWIKRDYPEVSHRMMLPFDVGTYGIDVPKEYIDIYQADNALIVGTQCIYNISEPLTK